MLGECLGDHKTDELLNKDVDEPTSPPTVAFTSGTSILKNGTSGTSSSSACCSQALVRNVTSAEILR